MGKICLISYCNLYMIPYIKKYTSKIINSGNECICLFWDRDGNLGKNDIIDGCQNIVFNKKIKEPMTPLLKAFSYLRCAHFFNKTIKNSHFEKIVFLQSHAAVLCDRKLLEKYSKKYVIEVRDYFMEENSLYFRKETIAIKLAKYVFISSPGYKSFLPDSDYIVAHNYSDFDVENKSFSSLRDSDDKTIKISYIGTVRFFDMDKKILLLFKNDPRFQINYYGSGSEVLESFAKENDITNVDFIGRFSPETTIKLYSNTDMINNLYGNNSMFLDYALSNKLYHAAQLYKPILVCKNTYMEKIAKKYGFGFTVDFEDPLIVDKLYKWYKSFNRVDLVDGCNSFISKVKRENEMYEKYVDSFICD